MDALMLSCFLGVQREEAEDQICAMDIKHDSSVVALVVAGLPKAVIDFFEFVLRGIHLSAEMILATITE
ncbi:hypothetical protein K7X08_009925 [Anisodus acutangulus]|uniref:Uncharacterized protein n=1 Tax=Anisodus acutangulus TaxID=402998 RepID=A0A9Q1N685_9SOLA|nr:hypothetical protein K7X08_009925 [Anisodus acutangulus]